MAALLNGQIDCVVIDNEPAKNYVAANQGLKILETAYANEEYAAAIAKDNTELYDQVNTAIQELKADGTIDSIIEKYIRPRAAARMQLRKQRDATEKGRRVPPLFFRYTERG